jgi:O-antigen/teichoic acid export membrane protein
VNTKTIARNTAWYGLENVIGFVSSLITSIAIARTLGPSKMGYLIYVNWLVGIVGTLGSVGILATIGTLLAVAWVLHDAPPEYRIASLLLVASIFPSMVNFVPAQANVASEQLSANLPGSVASTVVFFIMTILTIVFHWGVIGIASAMLGMRLADCLVRFFPTVRRILAWPSDNIQTPPDLRPRMMRFALQSIMGLLLTIIVWDRSELFLLKHLSSDIRQIAFYSVAFNLAERLLIFPSVFASASGASVFAQYGRDRSRLPAMTAASVRYLALISIPLHVIAVALAAPALLTLYGTKYEGALLVATVSPLLCLPKAFLGPIQSLFESTDRQKYFIVTTVIASFIDIGVAWYLIPSLGALGASLGSGAAQITAIGLMWILGIYRDNIRLPWRFLAKITMISIAASVAAYSVSFKLAPVWALITGSIVATVTFFLLAYAFKILEPEDSSRFKIISAACPRALAGPMNRAFDMLTKRMEPDSTAV